MNLPDPIMEACEPLFSVLPLDRAMRRLKGSFPAHTDTVARILKHTAMADRPDLEAGLWLYVDDLERSHAVSQSMSDTTGAFWHGIMHRREGDYANSHYWMRRASQHPLIVDSPDLDPDRLVDDVAHGAGEDSDLIARQQEEWRRLFEWCANKL